MRSVRGILLVALLVIFGIGIWQDRVLASLETDRAKIGAGGGPSLRLHTPSLALSPEPEVGVSREPEVEAFAMTTNERMGPPIVISADALRNAGNSNPESALHTLLWNASRNDITGVRKGLVISEGSLAQLQELFDRLPESAQEQFGSAGDMAARIVMRTLPKEETRIRQRKAHFGDIRLIVGSDFFNSDDRAAIQAAGIGAAMGGMATPISFRGDAAGWRAVVPDALFEPYLKSRGPIDALLVELEGQGSK